MKHLKLFFALFAMLALGVGNAWAQTVTWEKATSIAAGDVVALVCESKKMELSGISTTSTKYGIGTAYTSTPAGLYELTVEEGSSTGTFSFKKGTTYLYWTSGNSLATNATKSANTSWKVTISNGNATISNAKDNTRKLGWNASSPRFACYTSSQTAVQLYKKVISEESEDIIVKKLESIEVTPKTVDYETGDVFKFDGTCTATYSVTKNDEIQPNETAVVTPTTVSTPDMSTAGTKEITVTYTEDGVTKEDKYEINVTENVVTPGSYTGNLNNTFFGCAVGNNATEQSGKFDNVLVVAGCKSSASSKTNYQSGHVRFYADSYLTLSVPTGYVIKSIVFTADGTWSGSITASTGTYNNDSKTWTGNAQEVKFSFAAQNRIKSVKVTYAADVKYAVNITTPSNGTLVVKDGENELTSGAEIYEGTKLTVTATPETGYEDGVVVVKNASDEDVTADVYDAGTLTMPAYAVTISATFEKKPCTLLNTPVVTATPTYNSATLTWAAVANAAKYSVTVGETTTEVTEPTFTATSLTAETTYTYQVQAIAEAGQDTYCDSEVAEVTFTTTAAPTAKLTLKDIVGTTTQTGALNSTITLPTTAAECSKTFVGWDSNSDCTDAPEYKAGESYTLAAETQILYAVYADVEGGEPTWNRVTNLAALTSGGTFILGYEATAKSGKIIPMRTSGTATTSTAGYMYSGNADGTTSNNATLDMASISESSKFEIILEASSIVDGAVNIKLGDNYLGNTNTKNNCKLFTSASKNTAFTPTIGTNDVVKLTIKANADYTTLQFNNNSGSYRYAVYGGAQKDVVFYKKEITLSYSNYSTTCATAPIVTVTPETVTANATGAEGKVTVTYENVNTANVTVALYNDEACTATFTAGWLTASIDADKNIAYTVAENTTYAERKAYIKLTAPETTGATEPAVVVIPVTQAGKDKVFASLAELVAADLTAGDEVTVTLNNDVIKDFYINSSKRCGVVFDVQKDGKDIKIYFNNQTTIDDWAVGGKLSGTLTNVKWTTYSSAWQLAPDYNTWAWANLTYTEPKAVSTVVVSGAPTKTTYVDGEAFDPAGLTVTVNYNDATTEVNPTGVTFTVTPTTLVKGQTSVSVTATYNSVTSVAYEVTGLTVNDIPTKTIAEFIAARGTRCYLEGIVSGLTEGNSMKYGNFDLTDASGTIYVYGCLNASGEKEKFAELGVKNGDKIKVIADEYELYGGTKDEAKNVQYVSHISAASITISDITMEVGETKTIAATVVPAEAEVTYTIKENAANAISLSGNTINALAEGTAIITATVAEGATYLSNSVDFKVTVTPQNIATLPFAFDGGVNDIKNTLGMSQKNLGTDYGSSPKLKFDDKDDYVIIHFDERPGILTYDIKANTGSGAFSGEFAVQESADGVTYRDLVKYTTISGSKEAKTHNCFDKDTRYIKFIFATKDNGNVALGNIKIEKSKTTLVTPSVESGIFSVGEGKYVQFSTGNLQYEVGTNTWSFASEQYEVIGGEAYDPANPTNTNYGMNEPGYTGKLDLFGWSSDGKFGVNPSNTDADYEEAFVDWGNLVDGEDNWYTLTKDEMNYILNRKKDNKKLWALATVCGMNGLILLPDNWNTSTTLEYGYIPTDWNYEKNQLDAAAWAALEAAGAVFLPEGGSRVGGHGNKDNATGPSLDTPGATDAHDDYFHVDNVGEMGYYWLNTQDTRPAYPHCASYLILPGWSEGATNADDDDICLQPLVWSREKRRGNSVRLVKEVTPNYTRDKQGAGVYGTVCYPENIVWCDGATLYEVAGKEGNKVIFDEVTAPEAGMPYIFIANQEDLYFFCGTDVAATADKKNSLQGTFTQIEDGAEGAFGNILEGNYVLYNNIIKKCGAYCGLHANRAYFVATELENMGTAPAAVQGRRRISLDVASENTATGLDNLTNGENTTIKTIENGQLIIIRKGEKFNAQGIKF